MVVDGLYDYITGRINYNNIDSEEQVSDIGERCKHTYAAFTSLIFTPMAIAYWRAERLTRTSLHGHPRVGSHPKNNILAQGTRKQIYSHEGWAKHNAIILNPGPLPMTSLKAFYCSCSLLSSLPGILAHATLLVFLGLDILSTNCDEGTQMPRAHCDISTSRRGRPKLS
ncbi:hypothetical protein BDQ94DRAFT_150001 [Aspergillus welwitschiae]|uniref:Uncharacterized protein n=1 Tax=Aspergillus welwitschiae TaxID=1341132 RepID=A0A3F3PRK0_9EURO|nr:hypothetical protein BDQ94DRAFT_150001 [Aspergillus welwitschiae]RDH29579.1 hypothetical protein BDQ94DRAFT_150001 [Aspergillus welwitschiae]